MNRISDVRNHAYDISNPSYMGVGIKSCTAADRGWSYSTKPIASAGQSGKDNMGNTSPKRSGFDASIHSPTMKTSSPM